MFSCICALLCVLTATALAASEFNYDYFFPGTHFKFNIEPPQGCESCSYSVQLLLNADDPTYEGDSHPRTVFDLTPSGNDSNTFVLDNIVNLPDASEMGVYPNAAFKISYEDSEGIISEEIISNITFYKSQTYMNSDMLTLNVHATGVYSPGLDNMNYRPSHDSYVQFNLDNDGKEFDKMYYSLDYSGVKTCDHFALYDGTKGGRVLSIPTVFNQGTHDMGNMSERQIAYSVGENKSSFQAEFASDNEFDYVTYAPKLFYTTESEENFDGDNVYYIDFTWKVSKENGEQEEVKEGDRLHFQRGDILNITTEMDISGKFLDFLRKNINIATDNTSADGNELFYIALAMCHTERPGDKWSYMDSETCSSSEYTAPPPYKCVISGKYDLTAEDGEDKMKYSNSESTRPIALFNLNSEEYVGQVPTNGVYHFTFPVSLFETDSVNPIPFRVVPLVAVAKQADEESDPNIIDYDFVPLGPASPMYEIDLDIIPAVIFFVVLFVVIGVICLVSYFAGKVIRRKVKAKKTVNHKLLNEQSENSGVSMIDSSSPSSYGSSSRSSINGREPSEKDKLIERRNPSSSSASDDKNVA